MELKDVVPALRRAADQLEVNAKGFTPEAIVTLEEVLHVLQRGMEELVPTPKETSG